MSQSPTAAPAARPRPWWYPLWRIVRVLLLAAIGSYGVIILMLLLLENRLLFRGTSAAEHWIDPPLNADVRDVELLTADGLRIHAWWFPHPTSSDVMLYCHGNAGNLSHRGLSMVRWRDELETSVLIFDYPGYGRSAGSPNEAGCYAAADAAYQWLRDDQPAFNKPAIPPERLLIAGDSLGGGIATDLASRHPHRALVIMKAFTSIPDAAQHVYYWLPARWLVRNKFDNLAKISKLHQPVFIAHGTTDELVPFVHGERLFEAANEPKFFLRMEGVSHNDPAPPEFFPELRKFLNQHARAGS